MRLQVASVMVDDQDKALKFYTETLGMVKKHEIPLGEYKWLTVTSNPSNGMQLSLEPNAHPAGKAYQRALFKDKIPAIMLHVDDIQQEYERLTNKGVEFKAPPADMGNCSIAVLNDTCGNYVQLIQE